MRWFDYVGIGMLGGLVSSALVVSKVIPDPDFWYLLGSMSFLIGTVIHILK